MEMRLSVLQLRGVNSGSTPGGTATADLRTIYAYSPDGTGVQQIMRAVYGLM